MATPHYLIQPTRPAWWACLLQVWFTHFNIQIITVFEIKLFYAHLTWFFQIPAMFCWKSILLTYILWVEWARCGCQQWRHLWSRSLATTTGLTWNDRNLERVSNRCGRSVERTHRILCEFRNVDDVCLFFLYLWLVIKKSDIDGHLCCFGTIWKTSKSFLYKNPVNIDKYLVVNYYL